MIEGQFRALPDKVFQAWTNPDELRNWFGPDPGGLESVDVDLRVGGSWRFDYGVKNGEQNILRGRYLLIDPNRRLEFSWQHERHFDNGQVETTSESRVVITFVERDNGTFVRLVHEKVLNEPGRLGVTEGWLATFTNLARQFAATEDTKT